MSDIRVYGAMSDGEVGIILALPAESPIRHPEGETVPGIVLSSEEAREPAAHIISQVDQMEKRSRQRR
jgi:hypothetical protein